MGGSKDLASGTQRQRFLVSWWLHAGRFGAPSSLSLGLPHPYAAATLRVEAKVAVS